MAHRLDQSTRVIPWGGYRAIFSPSGFFISSNVQSQQKKILLSRYRTGTNYTQRTCRSRELCWHHLPPTPQVTNCNPWIKLSWSAYKYYTLKKLKYSSVQTYGGRDVTVYQIGEQFGNAYKQAATGEIATKGFRATGLFPCDKNIFRPHGFPLASDATEAAPVNHPALVKTSDQPSFSSANFSPFSAPEALRASDIITDQAWTYSQILEVEQ